MTPEGKVKAFVRKVLDYNRVYYVMPVTGGYGRSGAPDFLCCINGQFVGFECKAAAGHATVLQLKAMQDIESCGGRAWLVTPHTAATVLQLLAKLEIPPENAPKRKRPKAS